MPSLFKRKPKMEEKAFPFGGEASGIQIAAFSPGLIDHYLGWGREGGWAADYRHHASVYTVVEFLAWQIAQIGLKVYEKADGDDRRELGDSSLARTIDNPAPGLTYERMMHQTVADLCLSGNAYWLKLQNGDVRSLVPLPFDLVTPRGGNIIQADTYDITTTEGVRTYANDEIVHFRRYNPSDPRIGVSPLQPLRHVLEEERAASVNRVGFWQNAGRQDGFVIRPMEAGAISDEAFKRLQESLNQRTSGAVNSGTWKLLEEGLQPFLASFSPREAEFIEGRKLTLETVARAYNIPVAVLGLTDTATFASQREFHKALYQDTLGPWTRVIAAEIQLSVVPWFTEDRGVYVEFNIQEKLQGSFEEQAESLRAWVGVPPMSVNEWRGKFNLARIEDPAFDVPVQPANIFYGGLGGNGNQQPVPEPQPAPQPVPQAAESKLVHLTLNVPETKQDINVSVEPPEIPAPEITVQPANILVRNDVPAPEVHVEAPQVTVLPPEEKSVIPLKRTTVKTPIRNAEGQIIKVVETEEDVADA